MDAKKALAAASKITLAKYPDCDEATVEEKIVQVYRKDGTGECQDETYLKVLTEKGRQDWRTLTVHFELPYSTAEVTHLEIIKPNGEVKPVDVAVNAKETIDDSQMEENIYNPNSKILEVNIPGIEVGDVMHSVGRITIRRAVIPGGFDDTNLLEGKGFIRHLLYEVHAPSDNPLRHIILRNAVAGTVKASTQPGEENTLVYRWEATDVPRIFPEPAMPPFEEVLQQVLVTTLPTWGDVSKWYWELSKPHMEALSPELKKKTAELTAGLPTDMEKVKALFYFVSQKIRYMGLTPEKDRPGFEPHDVCVTFDKKYGVCRDKAALLVAMLREAGFKAYPVLVSVGTKQDPEVPSPSFNHAIAAVELGREGAGEKYTLMDPTDEHARDLLPWHDGNQSYLVARPEGETLRITPVSPANQNMLRIKTTGTLKASGELEATTQFSFDGANDDIYRGAFSHMKPDDLYRFFENKLKEALPGVRLTSLKVTPEEMLDMSQPLQVEMAFSVEGMTASGQGKTMVTPPWIGKKFGLVNLIQGNGALGLDQRKYPLQTMVPCGLDEKISLKLGEGFAGVESLPACSPVENESVGYHQEFTFGKDLLDCAREFTLKRCEFSPEQYLTIKTTLREMEEDARKTPILNLAAHRAAESAGKESRGATAPVASDAVVRDVQKQLLVSDAHSAVYRVKFTKEILTYEGKNRESEVKVEYNPACEEVRLITCVVTSKTGERHVISPGEITIMDDDASASAKRYTGGKVLVASLPGVEVGSTLDEEYEITMKGKPFISGFEAFQLPDALEKKTVKIEAPAKLPIASRISGSASAPTESITTNGSVRNLAWSAQTMKALPAEKQTPPEWLCIPGVTYFVGDFPGYLKELHETLLDRSRSGTHAAEAARQIVSQSKSKLETLRAIRDFVVTNIRLAGPSFTKLPLSELSKADTILAEGYGHEADRAILLHAMLTAAGFQPEFLLASDLPPIEEIQKIATGFPLPEKFSSPLVKVSLDGTTYYLNDTDQYAELGTTAHNNMLALNLAAPSYDASAYELVRTAKNDRNRTETSCSLVLGNDGKLTMEVINRFYGGEYNAKKKLFAEQRPEDRKQYFEQLISGMGQGTRAKGDLSTQFETYPGTERFTLEVDHFAVVDGNHFYFALPFTPTLFQLPGDDQRTLPFEIAQQSSSLTSAEITLPPGFPDIVIAPTDKRLEAPSGCGKVAITATSTPGKFLLTENLETAPAIISPADYPALLTLEAGLKKKSASLFLLEKKRDLGKQATP